MRTTITLLCTLLLLPALVLAEPSDALTLRAQLHMAKVEIAQLRAALADTQAKLAMATLTAEREQLARELRVAYNCAEDAPVDWQKVGAGEPPCVAR